MLSTASSPKKLFVLLWASIVLNLGAIVRSRFTLFIPHGEGDSTQQEHLDEDQVGRPGRATWRSYRLQYGGMSSSERGQRPVPQHAGRFATTRWSMVIDAGRPSSPKAAEALATLCTIYWFPLYAYVRRRGHSIDDAQDLTQEFFVHLLDN